MKKSGNALTHFGTEDVVPRRRAVVVRQRPELELQVVLQIETHFLVRHDVNLRPKRANLFIKHSRKTNVTSKDFK